MNKFFTSLPIRNFALAALALLLLSACENCLTCGDNYVADAPVYSNQSYIQLAPTAPPPPMAEEVPVNNNPRAQIWRPGHWYYNGSSFSWTSGEFIPRPSPTATWSPDHWSRHTYGWGFVPGHWQ